MLSLFRRKRPIRAIPLIEEQIATISTSHPSEIELMFFAIFGASHSFSGILSDTSQLPKKFKSDGICFETALYLLFRADYHAFNLDPNWRESIMPSLHQKCSEIFRDSFGLSEAAFTEICNNRVQIWGHLVRTADISGDVIEALLLRFIYDTARHGGVPQYGLDHHKDFTNDSSLELLATILSVWHPTAVENVQESVYGCLG